MLSVEASTYPSTAFWLFAETDRNQEEEELVSAVTNTTAREFDETSIAATDWLCMQNPVEIESIVTVYLMHSRTRVLSHISAENAKLLQGDHQRS